MNVIEVRGLVKSYGSLEVLRGLDLCVEQGKVYGFLGRNGAGKSTTLRVLVGILEPTSGRVDLFGEPMSGKNTSLRSRIGYVAQEQHFYGWMTPGDLGTFVKGFYPNWDSSLYESLLKTMELPKDRKSETFSGGMKAKLGLALAVAHNPPLLILDEPTAGLDPVARREFLQMVSEQTAQRGSTVLFSSHLVDEVERVSDTVGILEQGRMLYQGSLENLSRQVFSLKIDPESPEPVLPPEIEILRKSPRQWVVRCEQPEMLHPANAESLSLEDIFVELVTHRRSHVVD